MKSLRLIVFSLGFAGLAACAHVDPAPSTAVMPPGALGTNGDIDTRSLDIAAYSFGRAMRNQPADATDAIAALDYMGGELNTNPRWIGMDPLTRDAADLRGHQPGGAVPGGGRYDAGAVSGLPCR